MAKQGRLTCLKNNDGPIVLSTHNALIELHVIANDRCFTHDRTRSMIAEEAAADGRTGMNIDSRNRVCMFSHDPRQQWISLGIPLMRNPEIRGSHRAVR